MQPCTRASLSRWTPQKDFFVALDSDGCVLDTMEVKHKECFAPLFVDHYGLHHVERYAREAWEFVALYSRDRGLNRFKVLVKAVEILQERLAGDDSATALPDVDAVAKWLRQERDPSTLTLKDYAAMRSDPVLQQTLQWSLDADRTIEQRVRGVRPYAGVRECLSALCKVADTMVLSTAPFHTLQREWRENDLEDFVRCIAGQDQGSKGAVLALVVPGRYNRERTLMIGDAPGDLDAARSIGALFYPINPGAEEASWKRLGNEALQRFVDGRFAGAYQEAIVEEYYNYLPAQAPWVDTGN